ncbi:DUF4261 domain-containing protein [uncultured Clostridium sp.]|uniref:DUF4261 domain-containing protein n=1 Tax=uncultured Clostridium sp. TaxID=59620 RepID=UPI0025F1B685|nr:DUF4261 domain-containing protein [uncultured Clostridium sp.]
MNDKLNGIEPAYFVELIFEDESNMINTDKINESIGLYAIGLPDLQIHFHTLDPSDVIGILENYASYIFPNGNIINDEKVDGLYENDFWYCQHEKSIVPPYREVLDLSPGKFAGRR